MIIHVINDDKECVFLPPSARKLTAAEEKFFMEWTGGILAIVKSAEEALDLIRGLD